LKSRQAGDAEAIFSTPKVHLKELEISLPRDAGAEKHLKKLMDVCAKGTKCLAKFSYEGPELYRDSSKLFFERNKDSLSLIAICANFREKDEKLDELLNLCILGLPALEIVCLDHNVSNDTLKAFEKRGVYWVCGEQSH